MEEKEMQQQEEVIEVVDYVEVLTQLLISDSNEYFDEDTIEKQTTRIKNVVALATVINEAKKIENDRLKTQLEIELKDKMNERDNQVKKDTIADELKQRKNELLANKIESGAVLTANVVKNACQAAWIGGALEGEFSGYTARSNSIKALTDWGKTTIKTHF